MERVISSAQKQTPKILRRLGAAFAVDSCCLARYTRLIKQIRFKEHIQWAADNDQIDEIGKYLRSLNEDEWFHFGEG